MNFFKSLFLREKDKKDEDPLSRREEEEEIEERKDMIQGVSELGEKTVREVMVPRIDVQFIPVEASYGEVVRIIGEKGFSRYPIYEENIDNVIGILYAKDLISRDVSERFSVRNLIRDAFFVPDSKNLGDLLRDFKKRKVHIAVAVDEYGGVSGIVCMEDIIEVIVGEIQDEFDTDEEADIRKVDDFTYILDSRAPIEDINEELGLKISDDDFETVGGYLFEKFGRIPKKGDRITEGKVVFTIESIDGHKINSIRVQLPKPGQEKS